MPNDLVTLPGSRYSFDPRITQHLPAGTTADEVLAAFQAKFGVQKYNYQKSSRWPQYSYVNYPAAGSNVFNFFGQNFASATNGYLDTNIEGQNNIGNYSMFIEAIGFDYRVLRPATTAQPQVYVDDTDAIQADLCHGFAQAGWWQFKVGTNTFDTCPRPFLYSPPGMGEMKIDFSNSPAWTQAGTSPYAVVAGNSVLAYADLNRRANRRRILKDPLFIAPQQTFSAQLRYDSGPIPIIATDVISGSASLYIGARFDGMRFAPLG